MNTPHYSSLMKFIHWIMAFQIIALLAIGFYMNGMPWNETKKTLMMLHKSCGFMALIFIIARIITRFFTEMPKPHGNMHIQLTAKITSVLVYIFMTTMAFSGFLMSDLSGREINFFNIADLPIFFVKNPELAKIFHLIHVYVGIPLTILIGLHFIGTLYHHLILKDDTLKRMLPRVNLKKKM